MNQQIERSKVQPVFDPDNVGASLNIIEAQIPVSAPYLSGTIIGDMLSRTKGNGYEPNGAREYVLGDDPRHIDHRITARQANGWPYVREHYRDIQPNLFVVTDMLQTRNKLRSERDVFGEFPEQLLAMSAIASLLRIAESQGMPATVIAGGDKGIAIPYRQPQQGRIHLLESAKEMARILKKDNNPENDPATYHLADLLSFAGRQCIESVVAVVSDFRDRGPDDPDHGWREPLGRLAESGNELLVVETTDPLDFKIPETDDRVWVDGDILWVGNDRRGRANRARYESDAKQQSAAIAQTIRSVGAHHIRLDTREGRWRDSFLKQLQAETSIRI